MTDRKGVPHANTAEAVLQQLRSSSSGLSVAEATQRRQHYGANSLPLAPPAPAWRRLLAQIHNVLIYVLLASALISLWLEHYVDSGVIMAVVVVNALVGFMQEGKAEDALRAIMSMAKTPCMVIRNGQLCAIDSSELVPGDVVMLQAGDRVPADVRLFYCRELHCDESALTGESQPVVKHCEPLPPATALAERRNMAFMGTLVSFGVARGVVTHTGLASQIGQISDLVGQVAVQTTPLQRQLARFARQLTVAILAVSALTIWFGMRFHGYALGEMFQAAIGIAVSTIPEGLPAIVTIALAIGVQRMAGNHALVRRLPAVEVLGAVDVICSDKTGTLTQNAMTARAVFMPVASYRVSGEGYQPQGAVINVQTGQAVAASDAESANDFDQLCTVAMLCNDATLSHSEGRWALNGDPTEGALLVLALKYGLTQSQLHTAWPRIDVLPFDSERRYMATLHHNAQGKLRMMVKGAPERLMAHASAQRGAGGMEPLDQTCWQQASDAFATQGMRVMALAYKDLPHRPEVLDYQQAENGLVLLGLVGISDPPRAEAKASIALCQQAGMRVKMITGDNPVTAAAIARELGLVSDRVMTGQELDALSAEAWAEVVETTDIFARTSPANKLQLVSALQRNRHVVAMTGDGVNDAPALKQADIGVAMGMKGTDAAREAADFVLTDDNFQTIAMAVREGRTVYDNIVKSIVFILPTSLAEALVIFMAIMLGQLMPVTPAQVLWVNMITTVTLALALAFERAETGVMAKPPRAYDAGLFSAVLFARMVLVGGLGAFVVFSLFAYYQQQGVPLEYARAIAVNALVMIEVCYLFNCRFLTQSLFERHFFTGSRPMLIAVITVMLLQGVFSYLPASQRLFGLASIGWHDWLIIVACSILIMLVVEADKAVQRWRLRQHNGKHEDNIRESLLG